MRALNKRFNRLSTNYGIFAGIFMAITLFFFQIAGMDYSPVLKLSKYLLLGLVIILALNEFRKWSEGDVFVRGFGIGTKVSAIAALTVVVINLIIFLVYKDYAFSKYMIVPETLLQFAYVSVFIFIETLVFGGIITFIALQYLKRDPSAA